MKRGKLICTICGKGSSYKTDKDCVVCPACGHKTKDLSHVSSEDRKRVSKNLCAKCYKKEMYLQMVDEIGGFLGNRDWFGPKDFVSMALNINLRRWARYFGAKPKDIVRALKRVKREDKILLDFEVGDLTRLEEEK